CLLLPLALFAGCFGTMKIFCVAAVIFILALHLSSASALSDDDVLSFSYYARSCPQFESIVHRKVQDWVKKDPTFAPSILRLHFHDCIIRVSITTTTSLFKSHCRVLNFFKLHILVARSF